MAVRVRERISLTLGDVDWDAMREPPEVWLHGTYVCQMVSRNPLKMSALC